MYTGNHCRRGRVKRRNRKSQSCLLSTIPLKLNYLNNASTLESCYMKYCQNHKFPRRKKNITIIVLIIILNRIIIILGRHLLFIIKKEEIFIRVSCAIEMVIFRTLVLWTHTALITKMKKIKIQSILYKKGVLSKRESLCSREFYPLTRRSGLYAATLSDCGAGNGLARWTQKSFCLDETSLTPLRTKYAIYVQNVLYTF